MDIYSLQFVIIINLYTSDSGNFMQIKTFAFLFLNIGFELECTTY